MTRRSFLVAGSALSAAAAFARESRPMQFHLSCGAIGVKASQREAINYAAKYGFDAVDADGSYLATLSASELHDLAEEMKAKQVAWAIAGMPVDFRKDDAAFTAGIQKLPSYASALKRAGVSRVTTWLNPTSKDHTYLVNFRTHATRLREIASVLGDQDLHFGMEYVGPKTAWASQQYPFVHTMAEMKELIAEIGKPNVGIVLDSWHWYTSHEGRAELLSLRGDQVVSVDLNDAPAGIPVDEQVDSKRELPAATGVIDVKTFLGCLKEIGYKGPVRAEPFNEAVRHMAPDDAITATMASLKKAFAETA